MQLGWLAGIAIGTALVGFLILNTIHDDRTNGNRPLTAEYADCTMRDFGTPDWDPDQCERDVPWYAERPLPYAGLIGLAVFLIGGFAIIVNGHSRER
jgi:hypothetical protein